MNPNLEKFPKKPMALPQWVAYRHDKKPVNPMTGELAEADNPATWGTLEQALKYYEAHKDNGIAGIGYEFSYYDPYTGLDWDDCRDSETGQLKYCAQVLIDYLSSYGEVSPSKTGIHVFVEGKIPIGEGNQKPLNCGGKVEVYRVDRYFTVTGAHLDGTPTTIEDRDKELKAFHAQVIARPKPAAKTPGPAPILTFSDSEILIKFQSAKNGGKFSQLFRGDWQGAGFKSQSEAELSFCDMVGFYTQDPEQIDRLYRASALNRDKWDRPTAGSTYGAKTIGRALDGLTETYQGPMSRPQVVPSPSPKAEQEAHKTPPQAEKPEVILELSEFLKTSIAPRKTYLMPWIWEALIAMVSAWRGVGKSAFLMALINALSRWEGFGPWGTIEAVPCLYFDAEMTMQDTLERFKSIYSETTTRENLFIYSDHLSTSLGMPAANLLDEKWRAWMKDELVKRKIKLWVLDNIGAVTPGIDENAIKEWSPINRWLLDLRFAGISTILIHHEGKGGSQRGTSGREDNLDISISLKRPQDYRPEDGARFICHFEKARIRQQDLHLITDTEFQMETDPEGKTLWTWKNVKQDNKARVLKMLDEGISRKEIAETLGITGGRVSQIKAEAVKEGWITEDGKLTQTGYTYLSGPN